ncbi:MAG: head-tail connector protein [Holosporales bacterium]|jgi:uncharacterized phiE125 gp8 family phage protein|nr:head-tail connector protein [Holosporales bacterium]
MLKLLESSPVLAVSVSKVKMHLRIDHSEDDYRIKLLIEAATTLAEQEIGQTLLTKVWKKHCIALPTKDGFGRINLLYPPLKQIISIGEIFNKESIRPVRRYIVEDEHTTPSILVASKEGRFEVIYQAGFGDKATDVPSPIRQAILAIVADLYDRKENCLAENSTAKILLSPYKINNVLHGCY